MSIVSTTLSLQLTNEVDMQLVQTTGSFEHSESGSNIWGIKFYTLAKARGKADKTYWSVLRRECLEGR